MIAAVVNAVLVLLGSVIGLALGGRIDKKVSQSVVTGLALCVLLIGIMSAVKTADILCVILCMVFGILIGEFLRIEDRLDSLGDILKSKLGSQAEGSRFTEGFVTATLMFCVGSMAVMGSLEAGINGNYTIIMSKSVIDCVTAVTFAATMGVGVCFSALGVLVYQGALTLLAVWIGPWLPEAVVLEMSAVGGLLIAGIALNMLGTTKIRVGNMLPAIFMPTIYLPLSEVVVGLFR